MQAYFATVTYRSDIYNCMQVFYAVFLAYIDNICELGIKLKNFCLNISVQTQGRGVTGNSHVITRKLKPRCYKLKSPSRVQFDVSSKHLGLIKTGEISSI